MKLPSYSGSLGKFLAKVLPDTWWASYLLSFKIFKRTYGYWPSLRQPRSFNEWLFSKKVLSPRGFSFAPWVDKHLAKITTAKRLEGSGLDCRFAITLHHTHDANDPALAGELPRCVVKGTHGSGMTILIEEPRCLTAQEHERIRTWLGTSYFWGSREPSYRHLQPGVIIEEFLPCATLVPEDYKFFCFRGEVAFVQHDTGRYIEHLRSLYSPNWQRLPVTLAHDRYEPVAPPPPDLNEMLRIASKLSAEHEFVRVDLYQTEEAVFFGEMTFFPGSGLEVFTPCSFDRSIYDRWLKKEPAMEAWNLEALIGGVPA